MVGRTAASSANVFVLRWAGANASGAAHVAATAPLLDDLALRLPSSIVTPDDGSDIDVFVAMRGQAVRCPASRLTGARLGILLDPSDEDRRHLLRALAGRDGARIETLPLPSTVAVAEHTFLLMLALAGQLFHSYSDLVSGVRSFTDRQRMQGGGVWNWAGRTQRWTLAGKTVGVLGMGRVGQAVAARARGLGMQVIYHDLMPVPLAEAQFGVTRRRFDQVLRESDVVTLHLPLTDDTARIIDAPELAAMKSSAVLINTAHGGLIDEGALARALYAGDIAGAGLDVFAYEPLPTDSPLLRLSNVVLTPHVAGLTPDDERRILVEQAADLLQATAS